MIWKRVRTLWPRWAIVLALVAAWARPLNGPLPVAPPGHAHPELLSWNQVIVDGWVYFMAAAGACLGTGFSVAYYLGDRFSSYRRRVAEHSERILAAEVDAAREWAAAAELSQERDAKIEEGRRETAQIKTTVEGLIIQLTAMRDDLRAMRATRA